MAMNLISERCIRRMHRLSAVALAVAGALVGLIMLPVALADEPDRDIVLLIDNSQSVAEGDDQRGIDPADPEGHRAQLASFLVLYLEYIGAENVRVGAITFAEDAQVRVPLQAVSDWRKGDFGAVVSDREGDTTNFVSALEAASAMLAEDVNQRPVQRSRDIIVFTDGNLDEFDPTFYTESRYLAEIRRVLAELPVGTRVHLADLSQDGLLQFQEAITGTERISLTPTDRNIDESYLALLKGLFGNHGLEDYISVSVTNKREVRENVAPYRDWLRYSILSDRPVAVTFDVNQQRIDPLSTGSQLVFMRPRAGDWTLTFDAEEPATVFYKRDSEPLPITIEPEVSEWYLADEPVTMAATLRAGSGQVITPSSDFPITATVTGLGGPAAVIPMIPDREGGKYWAERRFPNSQERAFITYTVAFEAVGRTDYAGLSAEVNSPMFSIIRPARLTGLEVDMSREADGTSSEIRITAENFENILHPLLALTISDLTTGEVVIDEVLEGAEGVFHFVLPPLADGQYSMTATVDPDDMRGPFGGATIEGLLQVATPIERVFTMPGPGYEIEVPDMSLAKVRGANSNLLAGAFLTFAFTTLALVLHTVSALDAREVIRASRDLGRSRTPIALSASTRYRKALNLYEKVGELIHKVYGRQDLAEQLLKEQIFLRELDEPLKLANRDQTKFDAFAVIAAEIVATCFSEEATYNHGFHALQVIINYNDSGYQGIRKTLIDRIVHSTEQQDIAPMMRYLQKLVDSQPAPIDYFFRSDVLEGLQSVRGCGVIGRQWVSVLYYLDDARCQNPRENLGVALPQLQNMKNALDGILDELPDRYGLYYFRSFAEAITVLLRVANANSDLSDGGVAVGLTAEDRQAIILYVPVSSVMYGMLLEAFPEIDATPPR